MILKTLLHTSLIAVFSIQAFCLDTTSHILTEETNISSLFKKSEVCASDSGLKQVDCIYVINLDDRQEKWERTHSQLKPYGLSLNRFSAVNGWKIAKTDLDQFWAGQGYDPSQPPLIPGKLGCIVSHLSVLQDAYDRGYERIWILQDDIEVFQDPKLMDNYIEKLNTLDPNWGLLFTDLDMKKYDSTTGDFKVHCILGALRKNQEAHPKAWYLVRENLNEDFQKIRIRYGFHSVLVSRKGMELILNYFKHVTLHTSFDIDTHFVPDLNKYGLRSALISNACDWKISDSEQQNQSVKDYPAPYNGLTAILPFKKESPDQNSILLQKVLKKHKPKVVVELGSSIRKSTIPIAKQISKKGKVYAINRQVEKVDSPAYQQFLSNVVHEYLTKKITFWNMSGTKAAEKLKQDQTAVDFVYIDASKDKTSVYQDLSDWAPLLPKDGIVCGSNWGTESVRLDVVRFAKENNLKIEHASWNCWLVRPNAH